MLAADFSNGMPGKGQGIAFIPDEGYGDGTGSL